VTTDVQGKEIGQRNEKFIRKLKEFDITLIAGQAKSHCVESTIADLLDDIARTDKALAQKVYLLEDCTSPVVIPGLIDYTKQANEAFERFSAAGMHIIRSTDPVESWFRG
jgi:nicotinamidase-related amidase